MEFYTSGGYATADIDVVASSGVLDTILAGWTFPKRDRTTQMRMADGYALVIGVEDLIVDRMCA